MIILHPYEHSQRLFITINLEKNPLTKPVEMNKKLVPKFSFISHIWHKTLIGQTYNGKKQKCP